MQPLIQSIRKIISEGFLNEISQSAINHVLERNSEHLPFDDLFDGQLRKVIPINAPIVSKMKDQLQGDGFEVDVKNRKAFRTRETQRGPKKVEMKLGKAIGSVEKKYLTLLRDAFTGAGETKQNEKYFKDFVKSLLGLELSEVVHVDIKHLLADIKIKDDSFSLENHEEITKKSKDYLEFINLKKNFEKSGNELDTSDYSIVITRAPADVLRMSDHSGMDSCHAEGNDYFQCAITEAIRGGAIAYVVRTEDLEDIDLKSSEIFSDRDRGIRGIRPLSRIRLRNFASDDYSLAVPEVRSYGENIAGFKSTLTKWARDSQISRFTDEEGNITFPDIEDFVLRGGTYEDTNADELLNNLFDTDDFYGSVESEEDDEEYGVNFEEAIEDLASELSRYAEQSNTSNVYFYFDEPEIEYDEHASFWVRASVAIEMPEDVAKALDELSWRDHGEYIDKVANKLDISYSDVSYSSPHVNIDIDDQDLYATVTMEDVQDETANLDELKRNIDYWENYDFDIEGAIKAVRNELIYDEHLPGYQESYAEEIEDKFKNFRIHFESDTDDDDFNIIIAAATISNLSDIKNSEVVAKVRKLLTQKKFVKLFFNNLVDFFKPNLKQLILPNVDYGPVALLKAPDGASLVDIRDRIVMNVHFEADDDADDFIEFISTMDNNMGVVEKILSQTLEQAMEM